VNDCAHFAAGALQALTGADPLGAWRGRWADDMELNQQSTGTVIKLKDYIYNFKKVIFVPIQIFPTIFTDYVMSKQI
jgi:hypothetical protein